MLFIDRDASVFRAVLFCHSGMREKRSVIWRSQVGHYVQMSGNGLLQLAAFAAVSPRELPNLVTGVSYSGPDRPEPVVVVE